MSALEDLAGEPPPERGRWHCDETTTGAEVTTPYIPGDDKHTMARSGDWSWLLAEFDLDPATFEVEGNSVRISKWQQSARSKAGDRDVVTLYSYRARFRRIDAAMPEEDIEAVRARVQKWRPVRRVLGKGLGPPVTQYAGMADWQLGKGDGDGVAGTTDRVLAGFEELAARIKELRRIGRNIEALSLWNNGDMNEQCHQYYPNQAFTVQLNSRRQFNLGIDLWLSGIRLLAPMVEDVECGSVLCNHGQQNRSAGKQITDDSDNLGGLMPETMQRILADRPGFEHVRWSIPDDQMCMVTEMSGVGVALTHGHATPGPHQAEKEYSWCTNHGNMLRRRHGIEAEIWMIGHYHTELVRDGGDITIIRHPSQDGGSKNYTDRSGRYSRPGMTTMLVGRHDQGGTRGFSDYQILGQRRRTASAA